VVDGIVGTTKNYRERQIPLAVAAMTALYSTPRKHRFVFNRDGRGPLTVGMAEYAIDQGWKRAGLRSIGWHVLRHTFASWLGADGVPLPIVQALLGHSTVEMTMRYAHLGPSAFRSAINVLDQEGGSDTPQYSWAPGGQHDLISGPGYGVSALPTTAVSPCS
jgi:integrase